uniref:WD repeat-containing protein 13 n=1 Tax=Hirondellea gigas TaxID=1518452 RepID=A0A6A7FTL0_9CRUS
MACSWQQVLAVDAKFNNFRAPNNPAFKRLYLRRRSHLLRTSSQSKNEGSRCESGSVSDAGGRGGGTSCASYLHTRTLLLQNKYKNADSGGQLNSALRATISASGFGGSSQHLAIRSGLANRSGSSPALVPTNRAQASRAIVGGTSLAQNYAFSGVHHIFDQHRGAITMLKFGHNDNSLLCCASMDGTVSICRADEHPTVLRTLSHDARPVLGVDWSSSNDLLSSCSSDGVVRVWLVDTGQCLRTRPPIAVNASTTAVLFHPLNSNWIVVGGSDGSGCGVVQVVVLSTGLTVTGGSAVTPATVTSLAFNDHGTTLWAADEKGNITSFRVELRSGSLGKGRRTVLTSGGNNGVMISNIEYRTWANREARNPSLLVSAACCAVLLYSVVDEHGGLSLRRQLRVAHKHHRSLRATFPPLMSFHEGAAVVSGSEDGCVLFLDSEKPQRPVVNKLQGHSAPVLCPAFNYTESLLATGDASGIVILWKRQLQ